MESKALEREISCGRNKAKNVLRKYFAEEKRKIKLAEIFCGRKRKIKLAEENGS